MNLESSFQRVSYVTIWDNEYADSEYDIFMHISVVYMHEK